MHFACSVGNVQLIKALLHRGAFARVQNSLGKFPVDIAREKKHDECVKLLEQVTSPPAAPSIKSIKLDLHSDSILIMDWSLSSRPNYFPVITAVEVQLKQQKLFEAWRTIDTIGKGETVFKEAVVKSTVSYADGEATDVEDEDDQLERSQVEVICASFSEQDTHLEHRIEPNREEARIPNYYKLKGLNSRQTYCVRIRCANKYGWSDYSQGTVFCPRDSRHRLKVTISN